MDARPTRTSRSSIRRRAVAAIAAVVVVGASGIPSAMAQDTDDSTGTGEVAEVVAAEVLEPSSVADEPTEAPVVETQDPTVQAQDPTVETEDPAVEEPIEEPPTDEPGSEAPPQEPVTDVPTDAPTDDKTVADETAVADETVADDETVAHEETAVADESTAVADETVPVEAEEQTTAAAQDVEAGIAPINLAATVNPDGDVAITWDPDGVTDMSALALVSAVSSEDASVPNEDGAFTFYEVMPGEYTLTITTDLGDESIAVSVAGDPDAPSAPTALSVVVDGSDATVTWSAPTSSGSGEILGYWLALLEASSTVTVLAGDPLTHVFTDLEPGSYLFGVVALTGDRQGVPAFLRFEVPEAPALASAPTNVTAEQTGATSVLVGWDVPAQDGDSPIIGYRVSAVPMGLPGRVVTLDVEAGVPGYLSQDVGPDERSHLFEGLDAGTSYRFGVAAITDDGVGEAGTDDEQTDDWRAPSAPTGVSVEQTGRGQVTVRFGAPEDEGTSEVLGYVLGVSGPDSGGYQELEADVREVVLDDLAPGRHLFRILAVNDEGAGEPVDVELLVEGVTVPPVDEPDEQTPVVIDPVVDPPLDSTPGPRTPVVGYAPVRAGTEGMTVTRTSAGPSALARTGAEAGTVALGGVLLLLMGAGVLLAGRRRQGTNA